MKRNSSKSTLVVMLIVSMMTVLSSAHASAVAKTVAKPAAKKPAAAEKAKPAEPPCDPKTVTGTWSTNWGNMWLTQNGNKVTGHYVHDQGRIEGTLNSDGTYQAWWSEYPSYKPTADAGAAQFHFSPDNKSFTGEWGYGDNLKQGGWTGTKQSCPDNSCSTVWTQNKSEHLSEFNP